MALEHLITKASEYFNIQSLESWQEIRPHFVLKVPGCGESTLNALRVELALRGLTLKDDATPDFWRRHLRTAVIDGRLALIGNIQSEPFTVLIDSAEKYPWTFQSATGSKGQPVVVPHRWQSLGPSHGDYSIAGLEHRVHVERKSLEDALGTFLAAPDGPRGERWRRTLDFLAEIECGSIVIEASLGALLGGIKARGKRSATTLRRTLHRQILAWADDTRVPFHFCDSRRLAEVTALAVMRRYWMHAVGLRETKRIATVNDVSL